MLLKELLIGIVNLDGRRSHCLVVRSYCQVNHRLPFCSVPSYSLAMYFFCHNSFLVHRAVQHSSRGACLTVQEIVVVDPDVLQFE